MQCDQMTSPDLEAHFYDCASLVLARFTSWLRITSVVSNFDMTIHFLQQIHVWDMFKITVTSYWNICISIHWVVR